MENRTNDNVEKKESILKVFDLINYEDYQSNLNIINKMIQENNNAKIVFEISNAKNIKKVDVFFGLYKIGNIPNDIVPYFLVENGVYENAQVFLNCQDDLLIPSVSVVFRFNPDKLHVKNSELNISKDNNSFYHKQNTKDEYRKEEIIKEKNIIATIIKVIAFIVYIGGFFAGLTFGYQTNTFNSYSSHDFSFTVALTYWAISFISGTFILGFSEIINLLNDIKNK